MVDVGCWIVMQWRDGKKGEKRFYVDALQQHGGHGWSRCRGWKLGPMMGMAMMEIMMRMDMEGVEFLDWKLWLFTVVAALSGVVADKNAHWNRGQTTGCHDTGAQLRGGAMILDSYLPNP